MNNGSTLAQQETHFDVASQFTTHILPSIYGVFDPETIQYV